MGIRKTARAFTLIEAMVVVLIVGVLATLAVVAYQKWVRTARLGEAQDMIAHIRSAEESYKAENGNYLNVSKGLVASGTQPTSSSPLYPAAAPGAFKTQWGASCSGCTDPNAWAWLGIAPSNPVWYGYAVVAGPSTAGPASSVSSAVVVNGTSVDLSSMSGQPWYVVEAMGDTNGDGVYSTVFGFSNTNAVMVDHEGE